MQQQVVSVNNDQIAAADGYLRVNQIIPALLPISPSTWWVGVHSGRFPQPVRLGRRLVDFSRGCQDN
jgi:predicted DNA-binding transcriptional regulator AlpA